MDVLLALCLLLRYLISSLKLHVQIELKSTKCFCKERRNCFPRSHIQMDQVRKNQEVFVSRNAPNWPAMVSSKPLPPARKATYEDMKISCAAASLWMRNRQETNQSMRKSSSTPSLHHRGSFKQLPTNKFAAKIVRQCVHCQMLYTNYHICCATKDAEPETIS